MLVSWKQIEMMPDFIFIFARRPNYGTSSVILERFIYISNTETCSTAKIPVITKWLHVIIMKSNLLMFKIAFLIWTQPQTVLENAAKNSVFK